MKNHWLKKKQTLDGPLCVSIRITHNNASSKFLWDVKNCTTLDECLTSVIKQRKELKVVGDMDRIVLMNISRNTWWGKKMEIYDMGGMAFEHLEEFKKLHTITTWDKVDGEWIINYKEDVI